MATWYSSFDATSFMRMRVNAWESEVNTINNTSVANVEVILESVGGGYPFAYDSWPLSVWVGDVELLDSYRSYNVPAGGYQTIYTGSTTVTHETNGTKSVSVYVDFRSAHGRATVNKTLGLTAIARTSKIYVQRSGDFVDISEAEYGQQVRLYVAKPDASYTSTIYCNWNGHIVGIAEKDPSTYLNWTIPLGFMDWIPNSTSSWGTIYCETYSGTTLMGTETIALTTNVPSTIVPTLGSVTASEVNSLVANALGPGLYVKGYSTIRLALTGESGTYYSQITQYKVTFNAASYTNTDPQIDISPMLAGAFTVSASVIDSRGRESAPVNLNINVMDYTKPQISGFSVIRNKDVDSTLEINRTGVFSSLTGLNTATLKVYTSPKDAGVWTLKNTVTSTTGTIGGPLNLTGYAGSSAFDIKVELYDELTSSVPSTQDGAIGTTLVPISWSDIGAAIGKIFEEGGATFQVRGASELDGDLTVLGTGGNVYSTLNKPTLADIGAEGAVEYGSNANGEYIVFDNGVVIAWKTIVITDTNGILTGNNYDWNAGTMPIAMSTYRVQATPNFYDWEGWYGNFRAFAGSATGRAGNIWVQAGSATATTMNVDCFIIGRI